MSNQQFQLRRRGNWWGRRGKRVASQASGKRFVRPDFIMSSQTQGRIMIQLEQVLASEISARKALSWYEWDMSLKASVFEHLLPRWWHSLLWESADPLDCGLDGGDGFLWSSLGGYSPDLLPTWSLSASLPAKAQVSHPASLPFPTGSLSFTSSCELRIFLLSRYFLSGICSQGHVGIRFKHPDCISILVLNFQERELKQISNVFRVFQPRIQLCQAWSLLPLHSATLCLHNHLLKWAESSASLVRNLYLFWYHTQMEKAYFWYLIQKRNGLATSLETRLACWPKPAYWLDASSGSPITLHPRNGQCLPQKVQFEPLLKLL